MARPVLNAGARRQRVRTYILIVVVLLASLAARVAEARHVHFAGPHPVAAKYGGGFCYIETPHMHIYAPDHQALYQEVGDQYVFTGDPTPFGYDGEKYKYYGNHPVASVNGDLVYCYINGPHFHAYEPPSDGYKMKSGVAFYVGPFTPGYVKMRPQRVKMVNNEYRPYAQYRPVVEVQPPSEWQGEVYVAPPAVEISAPGVAVAAPGVVVNAPGPPTVVVNAPPPPVIVAPPGPRLRVVAPPPPVFVAPAPHVRVYAPGPPGIVVAPPRPVIVAPAPGVVVTPGVVVERREHHEEHWEHHDNGKHKGWYK
jgi:hypothetical protein